MDELLTVIDPLIHILVEILNKVPEMIDGLLDNPVGLVILLFVVPTVLGFCWKILKAVFEGINGVFGVIRKILFLPIDLIKLIIGIMHVNKQIKFNDSPPTHKKVKQDQDLATSLKSNLLDE